MYRLLIFADRGNGPGTLPRAVDAEGLDYIIRPELELDGSSSGKENVQADAALLDLDSVSNNRAQQLASLCGRLGLPVIGVVSGENRNSYDPSLRLDDFILHPFRSGELLMRVSQVVSRANGAQSRTVIAVGDLIIDVERYEVRLAGERVLLTYKEYQLLVLLASNAGKVYTRDSLLSQVWGYDYLGGTRTVDVHIRRLRSKIGGAGNSYIETIWNVGYRFNARG